jgi:hypothetical protein
MTNAEIALEFMQLGLEWQPRMLTTGNVLIVYRGEQVMCSDGERRDGWHVADNHGNGLIWFAADGHSDLAQPDLDDPATVDAIARQVVERWRALGYCLWSREVLLDGSNIYRFHDPLICDSVEFDAHDRKYSLLAALKAAVEREKGAG